MYQISEKWRLVQAMEEGIPVCRSQAGEKNTFGLVELSRVSCVSA